MKKILFFMLITTFICCKKDTDSSKDKIEDAIDSSKSEINITSKNLENYLKLNDELFEYEIIGLNKPAKFLPNEISFPLKENDFDYTKSEDFDYFTAKSFDIASNKFKIIVFNTYGDNDSKILNIQLNSYSGDKLIDALLLDCRFTFETEYYRNFKIEGNNIEIKKISIDKFLHNDDGDIIGDKKVNDTLIDVVKYQIDDKGLFIKH